MVREEYEKLRKKYTLPEYDLLNEEFDISSIEEDGIVLRVLRRKMLERLDFFLEPLEIILQPDPNSLANLNEARYFSEDKRKKVYELFKKLMAFKRKSFEVDLLAVEEEEVSFVNQTFNEWTSVKKEILPFLKELTKCWREETGKEIEPEYLG